jgi:hypothetical protein
MQLLARPLKLLCNWGGTEHVSSVTEFSPGIHSTGILAPPVASCVTLGMLLGGPNLSGPLPNCLEGWMSSTHTAAATQYVQATLSLNLPPKSCGNKKSSQLLSSVTKRPPGSLPAPSSYDSIVNHSCLKVLFSS